MKDPTFKTFHSYEYEEWKDNFNELIRELTYNYFACSFGNKSRDEIKEIVFKKKCPFCNENNKASHDEPMSDRCTCPPILTKKFLDGKKIERTRNIMVIGAGASLDSYSGIPGGKLLVSRMKHEQDKNFENISNRYRQDMKEICSLTGKDELDFENYLSIMSNRYMTPLEIRSHLEKMTGFRYAPNYFNELVAHMLKHSMLDTVINFNFEETLDQAIYEEIGEGNYYNIISDGHCIDLDSITADETLNMMYPKIRTGS